MNLFSVLDGVTDPLSDRSEYSLMGCAGVSAPLTTGSLNMTRLDVRRAIRQHNLAQRMKL
jgi:hypothetical protein